MDGVDCPDAPSRTNSYYRFVEMSIEDMDELVEYDIDEEDSQWLQLVNEERKAQGLTAVPQEAFETLMDRLEKECFFESRTTGVTADQSMYNIDENAVCCICNDGECHNTNAILFCDMCNLAVHQECYGVPYIPEGQWLCRRCLQSPSRSVDCVLCPNKGGAFKQTLDGRWAHVICAIWIPEVQFANTVFLEPIDGIKEIPVARWKLTCQVCRRRMGACIQCAKANCYAAFHVTCAQQEGLHMKIEMLKNGEVKKIAYCMTHSRQTKRGERGKEDEEEEEEPVVVSENGGEEEKEKEKKEEEEGVEEEDGASEGGGGAGKTTTKRKGKGEERKVLEDRKSSLLPVVNIPYVPQHRLDRIISRVNLHKKSQFIPKLVSFWKLKRQSRNGVPLLRRMQASNQGQRTAANLTEEEREVLSEQLSLWKSLRHDLERARLLSELVRKREKLKREQLRLAQQTSELQLCPLNTIMKRILDRLARKDPADIFAEPVNQEEVPDYLDVIKTPMDFGTMRKRVDAHHYSSLDDFESDFYLVWHNATVYNAKDTIYYRAAIRIKDAGEKIFQLARQQLESASINLETGLHDPDVQEPPPLTPSAIAKAVRYQEEMIDNDDFIEEEDDVKKYRDRLPSATLDEQLEYLEEKLEIVQSQYTGYTLKRKEKNLRQQLYAVRRQLRQQRPRNSDSDDQISSPRRPPPSSAPRNAEELASHVLHGSLRLTPSRQQILSYSGISLPDQPPQLLSKKMEGVRDEEEGREEGREKEAQEEEEMEEEGAKRKGEEGEEVVGRRTLERRKRETLDRQEEREAQFKKASDPFVQQIRRRAHRIQKQKVQRMAANNKQRNNLDSGPERLKKEVQASSMSENEAPGAQAHTKRRQVRGSYSSTRSAFGSSSSIIEATGEEYSSEEKPVSSPLSDSSYYHRHRIAALEGGRVPSASSLDDLTVKTPLQSSQLQRRAKRKLGGATLEVRSEGDEKEQRPRTSRKRSRRGEGRSSTRKRRRVASDMEKRMKVLNGAMNGQDYKVLFWDLVWAKCRGYPPYPALVIDPDMPSKGMTVNGEKIQAPSDEVLEIRKKNPAAPHLVRFFDGKRSWQWLPEDKIEPLGISSEHDTAKIAMSGSSKRSVLQAFQRAKQYQKRVESNSQTTTNEDEDEDSDS